MRERWGERESRTIESRKETRGQRDGGSWGGYRERVRIRGRGTKIEWVGTPT